MLPATANYNQQGALRNFLSLYNLTISDGDASNNNGSWEELVVKNDGARKALFGGGTQATSLIQHVWVGDNGGDEQFNSLPAIRKVVDALGILVGKSDAHQNHFHVDIRTPDRVAITPPPAQLLAGEGVNSETSLTGLNAEDVARFVEQAQTELNIEQGETTVFTLDIPDVPQHYASVMVAQSNQAAAGKERAIGICYAVDYNTSEMLISDGLGPQFVAKSYFWNYENKKEVALPSPDDAELVVQPKHGKVDYVKYPSGLLHPQYVPDAGYIGDDKLVFKVKVDGKIVRVHYLLKVTDKGADSLAAEGICKKTGSHWKISLPNTPVDNLAMQPLLDSAGISGAVTVNLADLAGGAVGQAVGNTITLDDNAAGHNWFIDPTDGTPSHSTRP